MDILNLLLNSGLQNNKINEMASKVGISTDETMSVISKIAPILMKNAGKNLQGENSSDFLNLINKTDINSQNIDLGNKILGFLTGSKENSRNLANDVSKDLGVSYDSIKQLLPMIASAVAGFLGKQDSNPLSIVTKFLDKNGDGSVMDDVLSIAGKFFK